MQLLDQLVLQAVGEAVGQNVAELLEDGLLGFGRASVVPQVLHLVADGLPDLGNAGRDGRNPLLHASLGFQHVHVTVEQDMLRLQLQHLQLSHQLANRNQCLSFALLQQAHGQGFHFLRGVAHTCPNVHAIRFQDLFGGLEVHFGFMDVHGDGVPGLLSAVLQRDFPNFHLQVGVLQLGLDAQRVQVGVEAVGVRVGQRGRVDISRSLEEQY